MSDIKELQDEEREALISIYEGDAAFKEIDSHKFQYKVNIIFYLFFFIFNKFL